ncbi:MAG: SIMPL domain-containing protein [Patescibacteria group bacterium]
MKPPIYLQIAITLLALAVIGFVGVLTWNAYETHYTIGKQPLMQQTITVTGDGKISAKPDIARVTLGVITQTPDVATGQKKNTDQVNAIIDAMKALGIKPEDMQTSNYQIYPQYDYTNGKQTLNGYQITQTVSIKVRDMGKIGDIISKAGQLGSNQVQGVSFELDNPLASQAEARDKAIADAKSKADVLVKSLGVHLGKIVGFSENGRGSIPVPMMYEAGMKAVSDSSGAGVPAPAIQSGSLDVASSVSITFELQ